MDLSDWSQTSQAVAADHHHTTTTETMSTYKIIRFYSPSQNRIDETIRTGLTLEQARAHCKDPSTREDGVFFDGYTEEL